MQKTRIVGTQGSGAKELETHVHPFKTASGNHVGAVVLSERFLQFNPEFHPFLNDDFGTAMNQNVAFGGTPELIHDGGDNVGWIGTAVQGIWDFADTINPQAGTKCVSLTSANNNDEATFADGTETDMGSHTAVTGQIRLETYNSVNNSIILQFKNNNVNVGNSIDLNDFIDTGLLDAYQAFVIPKDSFGIVSETVDEIDMTLIRTGGARPTFRFDVWQIENTGTPAIFKATTPLGTRFHITEIRIRIEDAFDSTLIVNESTNTAAPKPTMPNLPIDQLLGVSALSNGIVFNRVEKGKTLFAVNLKDLGDFLATGSDLVNVTGNATNTGFTLLVKFPEPIILEGGESKNFLSFTINDNLSGLTRFTAAARGALEI